MASLLGSLLISLGLESGQFRSGLTDAQKEMRKAQKKFEVIGGNMQKVGGAMSIGITAPFAALLSKAIPAANESAQALGQVNAALKSMGPVAGRTTEQLQASATALMHLSTFDDDDILRKVTANLLTFGNVAGEQFDRAQKAAVDLSTRMGGDLQASTILVGKALNDPIKGMGALRKVGIQLTQQQQDQVKAFVATGNAAGAQKIILGELERRIGEGDARRHPRCGPEKRMG
jgi:phage-related minor tail protein